MTLRAFYQLRSWLLALVVVVGFGSGSVLPARAVQPDEVLPDATLETRARTISAELRCLVCQNQSIDDSNAPLARALRLLVRERLMAKDTDEQVLDYIVERYGDFVLLKPPFNPATLLLWVTPLFVLLGGIWLARQTTFSPAPDGDAKSVDAPLSAQERAQLDAVLKGDKP